MKTRILKLLLATLCFTLISCAGGGRSRTITHLDGRVERDTAVYAQLGGNGGFVAQGDGGFALQFNGEKSFRDVMVMAGVVLPASFAAKTEQVASTAAAATQQTAIKATAKVQETTVRTIGNTATSLGNNPEANVGAINAVGNLFKGSP